jgi:hypothetical protein
MAHQILGRHAKVHFSPKGPRVETVALIHTGKTTHVFRCLCSPDEKHDHEQMLADRSALLARHDAVIDGYTVLVGQKGVVDGVPYEITDCHIRILGPVSWELYTSWLEDHGGAEPIRQIVTEVKEEPDTHMLPGDVVSMIKKHMAPRGAQIRAAHLAVADHMAKGAK